MKDDLRPVGARKPKVIQPLPKTDTVAVDSYMKELRDQVAVEAVSTEQASAAEAADIAQEVTPAATPEIAESTKATAGASGTKKGWRELLQWNWPPSRLQAGIAAGVVVLLASASFVGYTLSHKNPQPVAHKVAVKTVTKAPVITSTLTGLPVADKSVNQRPVTGVMIENSLDARPQSSLDQAGIVFEAVAEGGVTRFLALFQDSQPDYIGPVRSARPYYVQWCLSFDCSYAHVGGSPDGLADIKSWGVKDLDEFSNAGAYHRIGSRDAPHNMYTSIDALNQLETSKGWGASSYTGFSRKADLPYKAPDPKATGKAAKQQDSRQAVTSIDFTLSGPVYDPHFDYDPATNTYKRSENGQPHMADHQDGAQVQISPKVVVGIVVPMQRGALDASGAYYSDYQPIGSGTAYIFQDGTVVTGHWTISDLKQPLTISDDSGKPIALNAGQTWITAVTDPSKASYK